MNLTAANGSGFSSEQQSYLQGFALGADVARKVRGLPVLSSSGGPGGETITLGTPQRQSGGATAGAYAAAPEIIHIEAQDRQVAAGGKLCAEEVAKRETNALDMWDALAARAAGGEFPKGTDVFLTKFHGMFYVAPAQDSYMCRLRIPGGHLASYQLRGLADLAEKYAGGYADVTTRANLQLREIGASDPIHVLLGLRDLGLINLGSGADNIRNVTASPTSGIDPQELIETLPLAREMHHHILAHRDMYGLPRRFNIAFDGGGAIAALEDTNDIGFTAVRVSEENADDACPAGVYFQLTLGGITGHKDFARYAGVLVRPDECVAVAAAIVRVFSENGDRTDRRKARLKYLLDEWGFDKYLAEVEKHLASPLRRVELERCGARAAEDRWGHIGFHPQRQEGKHYVGLSLPVGRLTVEQLRGIAMIAERYGSGAIRLTVWQNLLVTDVDGADVEAVKGEIEALGLDWRASSVRSGLVACTGNAGCKYAAADTKRHAMQIAAYVEQRIDLDQPVNVHLTGCHHSCAQHYIGDIGLIATAVEDGDDMVEGYHLLVGGGYGQRQCLGRQLYPSLRFDEAPAAVARLLEAYLAHRQSEQEPFCDFANRHEVDELRNLCCGTVAAA
ncbi:MAG: NirA family protein [Planctomycetales bacterium]|nr:NirA family protein [Planctomycetales bacterium]